MCKRDHTACNEHQDETLPARLIDIGFLPENEGPIAATLVTLSTFDKELKDIHYLALSHCWGTTSDGYTSVPKTNKENISSRLKGIPWSSLSKTFQDALHITRALGMRYIWIDSLCIIQDDEEDFQKECSKMGQVYSNAICTIAVCPPR
jgi:hypothetical protein